MHWAARYDWPLHEPCILPAAVAAELVSRQRLLRALLSTLGDGAAAATKLQGLQAIRLLLAAFAEDGRPPTGGPHSSAADLDVSAPLTLAPAAQHGFITSAADTPCGRSTASGRPVLQHNGNSRGEDCTGSRQSSDGSGCGSSKGGSGHEAATMAAVGLSEEDWAAAAKKLGKRLEDGSDAIRIAACGALAELARCRVVGAGFSAQAPSTLQGADGKSDAGLGGANTVKHPTRDRVEKQAGGQDGNGELAADEPPAVQKLLGSLRLHACDDNPAVAAAAAAVVQQLQSSDLESQPP